MSHQSRWAARYAFVDELWRGRARVVIDTDLLAVLRRTGVARGLEPEVAALVDAMLPPERDPRAEPVWVGVPDPAVAAELSRARPGTHFVALEAIPDVLRRAPWEVALVNVATLVDPAETGAFAARAERGLARLGLLDDAGAHDRAVVVTVPVREDDEGAGFDYAELAELLGGRLGGGRIYGLYEPPMVAVVDFAENIDPASPSVDDEVDELDTMAVDVPRLDRLGPLRPDDEFDDAFDPYEDEDADEDAYEDEDEDPDDDVPLVYDNSLGTQEPALLEFVAVAAGVEFTSRLADGLSLIELPPAADGEGVAPGVRVQLAQARRSADQALVERQIQLERVDALERENFALRRQLEDVRADHAELRARVQEARAEVPQETVEAVLAREQQLRWRVSQLEQELAMARARPVSELEAEVASLRARLEHARGAERGPSSASEVESTHPRISSPISAPISAPGAATTASPPTNGAAAAPVSGSASASAARPAPPASGSEGTATREVIRAMDGLVRRIERGGIGTLQLRRELVALRRRLQN